MKTSKARVVYACKGCKAKSYWAGEEKHDESKHDESNPDDTMESVKTCSESGKAPHDK